MQIRELLDTDDAVSPVIGVILMVAITVILAAVIATFVLGLGDQVSDTAPQASFSFDYDQADSVELRVTHDGGDTIEAQELYIRGSDGDDGSWDTISAGDTPSYAADSEITAGDFVDVNAQATDTVRVVFEEQEGDSSATLGKWEGPDV